MPDFEDFYKYRIKNHKNIIFFSAFVALLFWNITKLFPYFGCLGLSDNECPTGYLYVPPNSYNPIGTLELYILLALFLVSANMLYNYFKHNALSWFKLLGWALSLAFLKYFVTATTLF